MKTAPLKPKVLRLPGVRFVTKMSKTAIYDKGCVSSKYFDPTFPARFKIGARSVAWDADEIDAWVQAQKDDSLPLLIEWNYLYFCE